MDKIIMKRIGLFTLTSVFCAWLSTAYGDPGKGNSGNSPGQSGNPHTPPGNRIQVPQDYPTIQAAIDAAQPGDIVQVAAGTYAEPQILITNPISVIGAGADKTTIDGGQKSIPAVGMVRILVNDGDVVFSGFNLINAGDSTAGGRAVMYVQSTNSGNQYLISENRLVGSGDVTLKDNGLVAYGGLEHLDFENNTITGTGSNPIWLVSHLGPTDLNSNTLDVGVYGVDAIFAWSEGNRDVVALQRCKDNTIDVGTGIAGKQATGITFAGGFGTGAGRFANIQIMHNTINNAQDHRDGISLWNAADQPAQGVIIAAQVNDNVINGLGSDKASRGIKLIGFVANNKIINNQLSDLNIGVQLMAWPQNTANVPRNTKIIANRFHNVKTYLDTANGVTGTKFHGEHISP